MTDVFSILFRKVISPLFSMLSGFLGVSFTILLAFVVYCMMKYQLNPFRLSRKKLLSMRLRMKIPNLVRWVLIDIMDRSGKPDEFEEYGLTLFCGRQGAGKTISMVEYLNRIHHRYPKCLIVTNFDYVHATHQMESWKDFMEIRNGEEGVVFAIDEIHSEYSATSWKDFPESLLSEISQQRKQRVKIVASSQVFTRVVKPIREQCFSVCLCSTFLRRWTSLREYDAWEYERYCESVTGNEKLRSIRKHSFVQSDLLRRCYDTYAKVERLQKVEFLSRSERGVN